MGEKEQCGVDKLEIFQQKHVGLYEGFRKVQIGRATHTQSRTQITYTQDERTHILEQS